MANIVSKEKSRRQDDKRELRNKSLKSEIKTAMKKAQTEKTDSAVNAAVKLIDKAVTSGVFHSNKAARLKSRMHKIETSKASAKAKTTKVEEKPAKEAKEVKEEA